MADKKLTPEQIEEIRLRKQQAEENEVPFNYSKVAREYGVTGQTIRRNIAPTETDMKRRPSAQYDPVAAKKRRAACRSYQFYAYRKSEEDRKIIEKLDSLPNKQKYIKGLILKDIEEGNKSK